MKTVAVKGLTNIYTVHLSIMYGVVIVKLTLRDAKSFFVFVGKSLILTSTFKNTTQKTKFYGKGA
jgi:hypothetical protein